MPKKATKGKKPATETKRQTSAAAYVASTVSSYDQTYKSARSGPLASVIARCNGWVMVCAKANARNAADQVLRLYRATNGPGMKSSYSRMTRKRVDHLTDPFSVGKSASYAETNKDFVEVHEHPVLDLLRNPNPYFVGRGRAFRQLGHLYREMTGNEFIFQVQPRGTVPTQLYQMAPHCTTIVVNKASLLEGYRYGRFGADEEGFAPDEVAHFRMTDNPFSPFYGCGWVHDILQEIDIYGAANANELAQWENGARPDYVVSLNGDNVTEFQAEEAESRLNMKLRGVDKRGKFIIMTNATVTPMTFSPKDMEYLQGKRDLRIAIFAAAGIPEAYIELNSANLSSAVTADTLYLRQTIRPRINQHAEEWTEWLLPLFGLTPGDYWFAYDNPVPEDRAFVTDKNAKYVTAGVLTADEARAEEGYEPLPDGIGSVPRINGIALEAPRSPDEEANPEVPADDTQKAPSLLEICEAVKTGQIPPESAKVIIAVSYQSMTPEQINGLIDPIEVDEPEPEPEPPPVGAPSGETPPQPDAPRAPDPGPAKKSAEDAGRFAEEPCVCHDRAPDIETKAGPAYPSDNRQDAIVEVLTTAVEHWFTKAARELSVSHEGKVDLSGLQAELEKALDPGIREIFRLGGKEGLAVLSKLPGGAELLAAARPSFDVLPQKALDYLSDYVPRLAASTIRRLESTLGDEAKAAIAGISEHVAEGISEGRNTSQVTAALRQSLNEDRGWRAERIARTESSRAYSEGKIAAWKESGVTKKRFLLAPDSCAVCKGFAAQFNEPHDIDKAFVPKGGTFTDSTGAEVVNDYLSIEGPPVHPQCRCTIVPVID